MKKLKSDIESLKNEFEDVDYDSFLDLFSEIGDILSSIDLSNINKKDLIISLSAIGIICFCLMTPHIGSSYALFSLMSSSEIICSVSACTLNSSLISTAGIFCSPGSYIYNSALLIKDLTGLISAIILYEKGESLKKIVNCVLKSAECIKKFFSHKEVQKIIKKAIQNRETIGNIGESLSSIGNNLKESYNENNNKQSNDVQKKQSKEKKEEEERKRREEEEERKRREEAEERRRREEAEERRRRQEA